MQHTRPSAVAAALAAGDVAALLTARRAEFGHAVMTAGGQGDPDPNAGGAGGGAPKTYDEAHVQRVATQQKAEGERAALAKIAADLGMTPEEAKAKLDKAAEVEKAAMSEADRKATEAAETKAAADKVAAAAAQETTTAKVTQALLVAGLDLGGKDAKPEDRSEKLTMAARLVTVAPGADDAAISAAVERVKTMVPQLFEETTTTTTGGGGDGGQGPTGRQQQAGSFGKNGSAEFERRHGKPVAAGAGAGT